MRAVKRYSVIGAWLNPLQAQRVGSGGTTAAQDSYLPPWTAQLLNSKTAATRKNCVRRIVLSVCCRLLVLAVCGSVQIVRKSEGRKIFSNLGRSDFETTKRQKYETIPVLSTINEFTSIRWTRRIGSSSGGSV